MNEKLRAHDYLTADAPPRRQRRPLPWHTLLLKLISRWWSGGPVGIGPMTDLTTYTTPRQAVWQVVRSPLALLLFLYLACCLIAGRLVSPGVFRAFLSQVFGWQMNGGF